MKNPGDQFINFGHWSIFYVKSLNFTICKMCMKIINVTNIHLRAIKHTSRMHINQSILLPKPLIISLRLSDTIWWHRSGSTLAQVLTCCLTAPSHYLNQCWLLINGVLWHSPMTNFIGRYQFIKWVEKYTCKISSTSPRGQWVKCQSHNAPHYILVIPAAADH